MGSKKPKMVSYDASVQQSEMYKQGLEWYQRAQGDANKAQDSAINTSRQIVDRVDASLFLLGDALKDRNLIETSKTPIFSSYMSKNSADYKAMGGQVKDTLGKVAKGYKGTSTTSKGV